MDEIWDLIESVSEGFLPTLGTLSKQSAALHQQIVWPPGLCTTKSQFVTQKVSLLHVKFSHILVGDTLGLCHGKTTGSKEYIAI